jgi:ATP-binding cassette subfamily B protein
MRTTLQYLRLHWQSVVMTLLIATLGRLFVLADPQVLRMMVDGYVLKASTLPQSEFMRGVLSLILVAVCFGLLARTFRTLQEYRITLLSRRVGASFYANQISRSLLLAYGDLQQQRSGGLLHAIQRARLDTEASITGVVRLYLGALAITVISLYACHVHWLVGAVLVIGLPITAAIMIFASLPIRQRQRAIAQEAAELAGSAGEAVRNLEFVKSFGIERQEIGRLERANEKILTLEALKLRLIRFCSMLEGVLYHALRAILLVVMVWQLYQGSITTGELLTLFLYSSMLFGPLADASNALARYQEWRAGLDNLKLLKQPEASSGGELSLEPIESIHFDSVSFRYRQSSKQALENVSFIVRAGETIAFTGASGAGKSSIIRLLLGLYTPDQGTVQINGQPANRFSAERVRARVGLVTQDTQLFAGTLRDNLLIAKPDANQIECLRALEYAGAGALLERGGKGLDAPIGEGGLTLSGGERQRLAIARALIRDPDVLVFDEATSNLDSVSQLAITQTIQALAKGRIVILVAHRLATIAHADRIYVLAGGGIEHIGTHETLLRDSRTYASLWHEQQGYSLRTA